MLILEAQLLQFFLLGEQLVALLAALPSTPGFQDLKERINTLLIEINNYIDMAGQSHPPQVLDPPVEDFFCQKQKKYTELRKKAEKMPDVDMNKLSKSDLVSCAPLNEMAIRGGSRSNTFGMVRRKSNGSPKPHQGWDIKAPIGTSVYAVASGSVAFTAESGDYGKQICFKFKQNGETLYAFYAHLESIAVKAGQELSSAEQIGTTGITGNASNLDPEEHHLHFEIRKKEKPKPGLDGREDPATVLGPAPL